MAVSLCWSHRRSVSVARFLKNITLLTETYALNYNKDKKTTTYLLCLANIIEYLSMYTSWCDHEQLSRRSNSVDGSASLQQVESWTLKMPLFTAISHKVTLWKWHSHTIPQLS